MHKRKYVLKYCLITFVFAFFHRFLHHLQIWNSNPPKDYGLILTKDDKESCKTIWSYYSYIDFFNCGVPSFNFIVVNEKSR